VRQSGGQHTNTGQALRYLREMIFTADRNLAGSTGTQQFPRIAVLIADERSDDQELTLEQARLMVRESAGVHVFAVGVGPDVDLSELELISSQPTDDHLLLVENYEALGHIREQLAVKTCTGQKLIIIIIELLL